MASIAHDGVVRILEHDAELQAAISPVRADAALRQATAATLEISGGTWDPSRWADEADGFGLLVLSGVGAHSTVYDGRSSAELLGPGDLISPTVCAREHDTLDLASRWTVLSPMRLAILDRSFSGRVAAIPEIALALSGRGLERARDAAVRLSIAQFARVDVRLTLLLWHLAERWGRVQADGVLVKLPLTHELISQLIAVRRPSVTVGLGELRKRGTVVPVEGGWLLRGQPEEALASLQAGPASEITVG